MEAKPSEEKIKISEKQIMDDFDIDDYVWWLFGGYYSWNNRVIRPASGGKEK